MADVLTSNAAEPSVTAGVDGEDTVVVRLVREREDADRRSFAGV